MSKQLRQALLDLVWTSDIDTLCEVYTKIDRSNALAPHEREVTALLFNQLLHVWIFNKHHPEQLDIGF